MQIANCTLVITPENKQTIRDLTPADAVLLHRLHFKESKGTPLLDIVITGEAMTEVEAAKPGQPAEYDSDHKLIKSPTRPIPAKYRPRTDKEERELLAKFYTGSIDGKPAFSAIFGNPLVKLPQTFEEVAEAIGNPPITDGRSQAGEPKTEAPTVSADPGLRTDGPTIAEYVAAGYDPINYPPEGFAAKSTPAEVLAAVRQNRAEIAKMLAEVKPAEGQSEPEVTPAPEPESTSKPKNSRRS